MAIGKMTMALLLVFAIEASMIIYGYNREYSAMLTFLTNPQDWSQLSFIDLFTSKLGLLAVASAVVVGLFFIFRVEVIYAGLVIAWFTFGKSIFSLWTLIYSQDIFGDAKIWVASFLIAPILIFYLIASVDFIRRPD